MSLISDFLWQFGLQRPTAAFEDQISNGEPENTVSILYIVVFTVHIGKLKIYIIN